jgi:hypothetical protein
LHWGAADYRGSYTFVTRLAIESRPAYLHLNGEITQAYNEAAFRYFLAIEKTRAERSTRSLLLVLVKLRRPRNHTGLNAHTSFAMFSALRACVREVDFVGWYRQDLVAGAVLTHTGTASRKVRHQLIARIVRVLTQKLRPDDTAGLEVRVVDVGRKRRM